MFTSRSFAKKFSDQTFAGGRGHTPLWPWKACFYTVLGLSIAVVLTVAILIVGHLWKFSDVKVEGVVQYDREEIASASDIQPGDGMMSFDRRGLETRLKQAYPLIRSVKINRSLKGGVTLTVTEETDLYYTCHHSNYYLISADDLSVLGIASFGDDYQSYGAVYLGFPEEARIRVGERIVYDYLPYEPVSAPEEQATYEVETDEAKKEYAYVMEFAHAVEASSMGKRITGMELADRYGLYVILDGRIKVCFGSMKELDRKIELATEILTREAGDSTVPAVLDVSSGKGTYREDIDLILPEWADSVVIPKE